MEMFYTVLYTVLSGTLVYVLGQLISKIIINPIHEQREVVAEIADTLIYYANIFGIHVSENDEANKAMNKFRSLSTKLLSRTHLVPFYFILQKMRIVISLKDIDNAHKNLIGLSNSVYQRENFNYDFIDKRYEEIKKSLNIKF